MTKPHPHLNPNRAFADRSPPSTSRWWNFLKSGWHFFRVRKFLTLALGYQYSRSRDRIEIDITYRCNLRCLNCNRSISQAPDNTSMTTDQIRSFINESIQRDTRWKSIRILGGEPTLHPQFREIITLLNSYRHEHNPNCSLEVVSNGHGQAVQEQLNWLPADIYVENSAKTGNINAYFRPFSMAPIDDPHFRKADFRNGCEIIESCGMGLGPSGYYPCAVAAGIDRVAKLNIGRKSLPEKSDNMTDILAMSCRLCGRFKDGHFIPKQLRPDLTTELTSPTWRRLYENYRSKNK